MTGRRLIVRSTIWSRRLRKKIETGPGSAGPDQDRAWCWLHLHGGRGTPGILLRASRLGRRPALRVAHQAFAYDAVLISILRWALTASGFLVAVILSTPLSNLASTLVSSTLSGSCSERSNAP